VEREQDGESTDASPERAQTHRGASLRRGARSARPRYRSCGRDGRRAWRGGSAAAPPPLRGTTCVRGGQAHSSLIRGRTYLRPPASTVNPTPPLHPAPCTSSLNHPCSSSFHSEFLHPQPFTLNPNRPLLSPLAARASARSCTCDTSLTASCTRKRFRVWGSGFRS
jgi:hypothetical protein